MNLSLKKIVAITLPTAILSLPLIVSAQNIVPCGTSTTDPCEFKDLITLVNRFISYFIAFVYAPFVSLVLIYIGFLFVKDQAAAKTKAKKILWNVILGTFLVLGAWILVNFVVKTFIDPSAGITIPFTN